MRLQFTTGMMLDVTITTYIQFRLWDYVFHLLQNMSFPSDRLLDVDKIKEVAALIIKCDIDGSRDLINPLFELVSH